MVDKINTVTVLRTALLTAIVAKAKANQEAYDKQVAEAENNNLGKTLDAAIEKTFPNNSGVPNLAGYYKTDVETQKANFLRVFGQVKSTSIPKPKLFEQEIAILNLATDESLILPIGHNLLTVL